MRRLLFWGTITAGATAAYLMYRRGEPVGNIARKIISNRCPQALHRGSSDRRAGVPGKLRRQAAIA